MKEAALDGGWGKMTQNAGTRHWMAPEVILGSSYDEKVDVSVARSNWYGGLQSIRPRPRDAPN